ncbi:hypothetical protein ACFP2T_41890 [Plantactinospora solaniradicis]|uniref:Uncharacterized protein n=1 Tax=Plantactinospora solaniradicis TaxID=1723736 RepID=A0ABW1KM58_9ACTN
MSRQGDLRTGDVLDQHVDVRHRGGPGGRSAAAAGAAGGTTVSPFVLGHWPLAGYILGGGLPRRGPVIR